MCSRFLYLILADIFVFITVTIAVFVNLEWWQAALAALTTFLFLVIANKFIIKAMVQKTFSNIGNSMKSLFDVESNAMPGASVDVHAVRPTRPPAEVLERAETAADLQNLRWHEIEVTIFPATKQCPLHGWDLNELQMVPVGTPEPRPFDNGNENQDGAIDLFDVKIVIDGEALQPGSPKVEGAQRLRFSAGVPRDVRELAFRYYSVQFGRVRLSAGPALLG